MVTEVQIPERWQTKITSISEGIKYIYDSKEFADVTFFVQGKSFKAHKLVLASRSAELARILMAPNATDEYVAPQTVTETGFKAFIGFIYTNKLDAVDKKSVVEAYECAIYYGQKALQKKCLEEIESWTIEAGDACELLGAEFDIPALREKCIAFVRENGRSVVESEAFPKAGFKTLAALLSSGALADVPVFQRIESVMKWGKCHFGTDDTDSRVRKELLEAKPPLLGKLGFENLNVEDLPKLHRYPKLLTDTEIRQIIFYWGTRNRSDLPSWIADQ